MKIFIAVDNKNGMLFNNRRVSQDIELRNYILETTNESSLSMNEYSFKQFASMENISNIIIDENFLDNESTEYAFVENLNIETYVTKIEKIYLCKWNRDYPSDLKLDIDVSTNFKLISSIDVIGQAHEKITIEEWSK